MDLAHFLSKITSVTKSQTISKTHNSPSPLPNEDRIWVERPRVWALADGAGGTGILCGEWAEFLLKNLPDAPIHTFEEFITWLEPQTEAFVQQYEPLMQQDVFQLKRFYQEGSASTLVAVWQTENEFHWLTFGDSHVFFYANNCLESYPFQKSEELSGGTHLLNWSVFPNELGFRSGTILKDKVVCLLATDAISKHILEHYHNNPKGFKTFIKTISKALKSEEIFWQYIKNNPDIEEDDYSLIILQP
jgi:Protein phosphatase 2C